MSDCQVGVQYSGYEGQCGVVLGSVDSIYENIIGDVVQVLLFRLLEEMSMWMIMQVRFESRILVIVDSGVFVLVFGFVGWLLGVWSQFSCSREVRGKGEVEQYRYWYVEVFEVYGGIVSCLGCVGGFVGELVRVWLGCGV